MFVKASGTWRHISRLGTARMLHLGRHSSCRLNRVGALGYQLGTSMSRVVYLSTSAEAEPSQDSGNELSDREIQALFASLPTNENSSKLLRTRHTASHVMAMAVQRVMKDAKTAIGPWIDHGFYYDFHMPSKQLSDSDLKNVKKEMDRIIKANLPLRREEVTRDEARRRISLQNEPYKLEILDSIQSEPITIYHIGNEWWDLCAGPHLDSTGDLDSRGIELQSVAGAYWRGDEKNAMLQRVYGTAWENAQQLKLHKRRMEEAKRRDHRLVGKKLNLFSIQEDAGGGLVFWHQKGSIVRRLIEDFWKDEHVRNGYELLYTPHIANVDLWKTSGHVDFYKDDMFKTMSVDNAEYQIRPMNCPFHCLVYKDGSRSYKELPLRWAELGTVYRYERSGALHGLFRVRGFTQDDAHIFCLPEQLEDEIVGVLNLTEKILTKFGFHSFDVMLSTRPKDSVGSDEIWEQATKALIQGLRRKNWTYSVDEGGGAFYGPKIDIKIQDAIGRKWQCSTIQADFNLPQRFELEYTHADGDKRRPIMLHRAIFGSLERFFGVLVENTVGDFPLWLAPVQLRLVPVTESVLPYCEQVKRAAAALGVRVDIDKSGNRLPKLIRNAELDKIPVMAVVGDKEEAAGELSLRQRKGGELGSRKVQEVLAALQHASRVACELREVPGFVPIDHSSVKSCPSSGKGL